MVKHFRIKADELYEMHVTVFGMDREDCWDKISGTVQGVFGEVYLKDYWPSFAYC